MPDTITPQHWVRRQRDVLAHPLDDDLVMAHLENGHYYGVSGTARLIWEALAQPVQVAQLCTLLQQAYAVDTARCTADVLVFLNTLHAEDLLVIGEGPASSRTGPH